MNSDSFYREYKLFYEDALRRFLSIHFEISSQLQSTFISVEYAPFVATWQGIYVPTQI